MATSTISSGEALRRMKRTGFPLPGLMDLYVAREMLMPFIVALVAALVIFLGNELFWSLYNILFLSIDPDAVLKWLFLSVPKMSVLAIPVATVFAVSMGTHRMARESEITAWRMCGASVLRITTPFFAFALLLSTFVYWLNEMIVPWATHEREVIMTEKIRHADPVNWIENDSFFKVGDQHQFYVRQVDHHTNILTGVMVYERDPKTNSFSHVFLADQARRQGKRWILNNCVIHEFDSKKRLRIESRPVKQVIIRPRKAPDIVFTPQKSNAWEMTTSELRRLIDDQESKGLKTMALQTWRVEYCHKFSLPLSALAAALVAAPLALRFARSGSFAGFLIAVTLVFFYQGFDGWFVIMGYRGLMSPLLAAWATNLLYGSSALILLSRER